MFTKVDILLSRTLSGNQDANGGVIMGPLHAMRGTIISAQDFRLFREIKTQQSAYGFCILEVEEMNKISPKPLRCVTV